MSNTNTQKALAITYKGGPFELIRHAIPTPGPGEILVKIEGVGLNQSDWKYQTGVVDPSNFTAIDVGEGVTRLSKGDRVRAFLVELLGWITAERTTFQEYTIVEAELTAKIPETLTALEAASIPACISTAAMIFWASNLQGTGLKPFWEEDAEGYYSGTSKSILSIGASSITGLFALQIARYLGLSSIITTSSLKHTEYLKSMGATHVIDRHTDIMAAVEKLKGEGIEFNFIFDAVHLVFNDGRRGVMATMGVDKELKKAVHARIKLLLEKGMLKAARVEKIGGGLGGIAEGLKKMERHEVSGVKLVVGPTETPDS
ncbi:chaperonin 10-like protein [Mycena metata]|uniref:Chaperonin 10-like protein n=1 Tax=Mycena metata TaxID=1033252 RepID=A0AAD7IIR5_9AGAR|nr:chaperonin 10-like protein [Mycena metata]